MSPIRTSRQGDFVGIMEAGVTDGAASDNDRVENGDRSGGAGVPDRNDDIANFGSGFLQGI